MTQRCARCDAEQAPLPGGTDPEGWVRRTSSTGRAVLLCGACADSQEGGTRTASTGDPAADRLRLYIERIERLDEERRGLADDIRDVISEARAAGYETKVLREVIKRRRMAPHDRREFLGILETYEAALGME